MPTVLSPIQFWATRRDRVSNDKCECAKVIEMWFEGFPGYWHREQCAMYLKPSDSRLPTPEEITIARFTERIATLEADLRAAQDDNAVLTALFEDEKVSRNHADQEVVMLRRDWQQAQERIEELEGTVALVNDAHNLASRRADDARDEVRRLREERDEAKEDVTRVVAQREELGRQLEVSAAWRSGAEARADALSQVAAEMAELIGKCDRRDLGSRYWCSTHQTYNCGGDELLARYNDLKQDAADTALAQDKGAVDALNKLAQVIEDSPFDFDTVQTVDLTDLKQGKEPPVNAELAELRREVSTLRAILKEHPPE